MCYRDPLKLLELLTQEPLPKNRLGHTALDDFEHFCAYSGLSEELAGREGFAWTKAAYVSAWRP
jgi:hypothetical protein